MEHIDVINRIIEAEQSARSIAEEAEHKRETLHDDIEAERAALRRELFERAEKRIKVVADEESASCDEILADLDRKLASDLDNMEKKFLRNRETWVTALFDKIVNR